MLAELADALAELADALAELADALAELADALTSTANALASVANVGNSDKKVSACVINVSGLVADLRVGGVDKCVIGIRLNLLHEEKQWTRLDMRFQPQNH